MKKIFTILTFVLLLVGCSMVDNMDNTPTKKVEKYLNNYQTLESNVLAKIDAIVANETGFNEKQQVTYTDILKKHYQNLTYKIKEETVNGDKATVEVEIEVTDYTRALKQAESDRITNETDFMDENSKFDENVFNDYRLKLITDVDERVKYTIYFSLTKENDEWMLDDLTETEEEKILGIYEY